MTRTRQTKGSTSSESSAFGSVFAPSATKMQETLKKMLAAGRLVISNPALSAIFGCGFGAEMR